MTSMVAPVDSKIYLLLMKRTIDLLSLFSSFSLKTGLGVRVTLPGSGILVLFWNRIKRAIGFGKVC